MDRIKRLREIALAEIAYTGCYEKLDEFFYKFFKRFDGNNYDEAYSAAFAELTPNISDDELIVGRFECNLNPEEKKDWLENYKEAASRRKFDDGGAQDSHMTVDYELLLNEGAEGILKKIEGENSLFYNSCKNSLKAIINHSNAYADKAEELAASASGERKEELLLIAKTCRKVPAKPAESFYEAVQSVNFLTYCLSLNPLRYCPQLFPLGHPDRYLYPFYEKDINSGAITKEYAQILLDCFSIQMNMHIPSGLAGGYLVGGRDRKGNIVQNELTEMCMQVVDDIKLVYPAVGLCYTKGMDDKYLRKACSILMKGHSHPAVFNDDVITKGLLSYGVDSEDAHEYIHSTCVEITPVGASNVWVASPYTNMVQILLDSMDREYNNFDDLINEIFKKLDDIIKKNYEDFNARRAKRAERSCNPLLSCFVNDCLKRGVDIENGGARYNWIMPSFVGVANLVDSVYAVKELVFDKKQYTIAQLKEILDGNFEGSEGLRQSILNGIPKYGNDIDDIDKYFGLITEHIISECEKYTCMHSCGNLIPSVFCWVMHERFGKATGATPDGRLAGFPLGDGSGPCQGREMNGPTSSVISSTKWEHHKFIGGVAVNMKFSKKSLGSDSEDTMMALIKTYLERGGFEMQINVVDAETLKRAVENPEEYKDLVVRIGGYSDYFVRLSPEMQQEVMLRTTHEI